MIFVTLEGIDNAGKTTIADKLHKELSSMGINSFITRELIETDVGKRVLESFRKSEYLSSNQKTLYFALDRQIRYEEIIKQNYDVVIWDRYVYSSFVYREMEKEIGEDINIEWVKRVNSIFKKSDLNIYVDVDINEAMDRALKNKRILPYTKEQLEKCKEIYLRYVSNGELEFYQGYNWLKTKILEKIDEYRKTNR